MIKTRERDQITEGEFLQFTCGVGMNVLDSAISSGDASGPREKVEWGRKPTASWHHF